MNNWFLFPLSKLETGISNFSFYSRNPRSEFHISLSTLEIRDQNLVFLFLLSKFETRISNFSFYSRNSRSEFQISLSTLEIRDQNFKFLFLLSNLLFLTLVNACLHVTFFEDWFGLNSVCYKSEKEVSCGTISAAEGPSAKYGVTSEPVRPIILINS